MLRQIATVALATLLGACGTAGSLPPTAANFDLCVRAERACDPDRLAPAQRAWIAQRDAALHLEDCLNRRRCNATLLDDAQRERVRTAVARLNHAACLRGEVDCDAELLDGAQRIEVAEAARRRNLDRCLGGLTLCDASHLSPDEAAQVRAAYLARNFSGCMNTVGTLVACNMDDLTPAQRESVRQRNLAVNFYLCVTGGFGCDRDRLTEAQRAGLPARGALSR